MFLDWTISQASKWLVATAYIYIVVIMCFPGSYLPILVFPSGNGQPCAPLASRQRVETCTIEDIPSNCGACDSNSGDFSDYGCGHLTSCGGCREGQHCGSSADCASGLMCSNLNTCVGEWESYSCHHDCFNICILVTAVRSPRCCVINFLRSGLGGSGGCGSIFVRKSDLGHCAGQRDCVPCVAVGKYWRLFVVCVVTQRHRCCC